MSFSKEIVEDALVACGRSCCICHKFCGVRIETHHLKPKHKGGDDDFENCIPLCFDCHAEVEHYNNNHPRGRKFTEGELRKHRDNWYTMVRELNTPRPPQKSTVQVLQTVNGKGNMVAGRDLNIVTERVVKKTVIQTDPGGKHISNATARKIQELVKEYIDLHSAAGKDSQRAAQRIWSGLKKEFNVTTYKEMSVENSEEAIQWLYAQIAMARPKVRRKNPERWKQSFYKPIYARANELGMSKEEIYEVARIHLALKKPINSLKDLTQKNLEKLHHIMIAKVNKLKRGV
ncbi:MAG: HNH endonuclease signature motif containing protein [Candidatus Thiodiazotropha sp.]